MKEPVMSRISGTATALVLGIVAVSQPSSGTAEVGKAERELMQLERAWSAAYQPHPRAAAVAGRGDHPDLWDNPPTVTRPAKRPRFPGAFSQSCGAERRLLERQLLHRLR